MSSFSNKKRLKFTITLGTGKFGSSGNDQVILDGLRASVDIDKAGGMQNSKLHARIFGVKVDTMNAITTLQWQLNSLLKNTVEVTAIDGDVETVVFAGNIITAWGDYASIPDAYLQIQAQAAFYNQLAPVPPVSIKGPVDVPSLMQQIATKMGYKFENSGVVAKLSDIYLANTGKEQAYELAKMAGCDIVIDDQVLAIMPRGGARRGQIPLINKLTGLIGYPTFDGVGVQFSMLYSPAVTFGGKIKLETDIPRANGEWNVGSIAYRLESERPGGAWYANVRGYLGDTAIYR